MTVAPDPYLPITGRGQRQSAVRKTKARPPAPGPVSQVAVDLEARTEASSGA